LGLTLPLIAGCPFSSNLRLLNQSGHTLTPYPVVTDPPPPHREADTAHPIAPSGSQPIDPAGFNPVYYTTGVTDQSKANGLYIGLDLEDAPLMIQYKTFHYKVPPGQAGKDPALQPILLHSGVEEVQNVDLRIVVRGFFPPGVTPPPGGWEIMIFPD
jgi:hypothetical protein